MANLSTDTIEPDPSATSIANDETVNGGENQSLASANLKTLNGDTPTENQSNKVIDGVAAAKDTVKAFGGDVSIESESSRAFEDTGRTVLAAEKDGDVRVADAGKAAEPKQEVVSTEDVSKSAHKPSKDRNSQFTSGNRDGRAGARYEKPRKNYSDNVKSDLTSQEESSDPVEFYFSDSNLHMDQFLYSKVNGHKNNPVPLNVIHAFKRMRHFLPYSAVVAALKESTVLNLVDDDSAVQRKVPLAEELQNKDHREVQKVYEDKAMARTIYVKGFGLEKPGTQFDLEAFFTPFGPVNSVRLRRTNEKQFKGSVFVEFDSEDTAKTFLDLDPAPKWNGKDLIIKSKKQYCDEKVKEINAGRMRPTGNGKFTSHKQHKDGSEGRDWRERRSEDQKRGFKDDRNDKHHKGFGSGRHRGSGRGGRDRNNERQKLHEVPKVIETTEDPIDEHLRSTIKAEEATDNQIAASANSTDIAGETLAQDQAKSESEPHLGNENSEVHSHVKETDDNAESKKRPHVADESTETQPSVKKVDIKAES